MLKRVLGLLLFVGLLAIAGGYELRQRWEAPLVVPTEGYPLTIASGETLQAVARRLEGEGIYPHPWLLRLYGRWSGLDQQIKRGEYLVPAGTTPLALLHLLREGKVISYQVTLPEGITLAQALEILGRQSKLEHVLEGIDDQRILELTAAFPGPEGLFFPDSYQYERGASDWDVLQRAYRAMAQVLDEEWAERAAELPYQNAYDALIMASIVERETGMPEERGEIDLLVIVVLVFVRSAVADRH